MSLLRILNRRIVGFRVIELVSAGLLTAMVLTVYLAKVGAGDKTDDSDHIQQQIIDTQADIRLLKVELANEERPERLTALAAQYLNMAPIAPKHEIDADALADVVQTQVQAQAHGMAKSAKPVAGATTPVAAPAAPPQSPLQPAAYSGPPVSIPQAGGAR